MSEPPALSFHLALSETSSLWSQPQPQPQPQPEPEPQPLLPLPPSSSLIPSPTPTQPTRPSLPPRPPNSILGHLFLELVRNKCANLISTLFRNTPWKNKTEPEPEPRPEPNRPSQRIVGRRSNWALAQQGRSFQHRNVSALAAATLCVGRRNRGWRGTKWPARRCSTHVWVSSRDPDARKTVCLDVELKLKLPSPCEETNQAAGLAIGGEGGGLPVQGASTCSWVVEPRKLPLLFFLLFFLRSSQCKAAQIASGGADRK